MLLMLQQQELVQRNALTATTLETTRAIGGVDFNGSAAINLPGVNANQTNASLTWAGNAANCYNSRNLFRKRINSNNIRNNKSNWWC